MGVHKIINRFNDRKTLVNGSLFTIFSFFNQGCSFVLLLILAKFIPPSEYGELNIFNTVTMLLGYFVALSCQGYITVSYFQKDRKDFPKDFSSIVAISLSVLFIFCAVLFFFGDAVSSLASISKKFLWIAVAISFANMIFNVLLDYLRIQEKVATYGLYSCGYATINFVVCLILVISFEKGWTGRVYSQLICTCIFAVVAFFVFFKSGLFTSKISLKRAKEILLWGIPLIPHLATTWIRQGCDRYIINDAFSLEEVGLFSFAINMANVIVIVGLAFNSTISVTQYQILSGELPNKKERLRLLSKKMIFAFSVITLIVAILGSILCPLILPNYSGAVPYFILLSVYGLFQCLYYIYCNYLFYYNKNHELMVITFTTSVLHLLLSLAFTRYSLYCTCFIYILTQLLIFILVKHRSLKCLCDE